MAVSRARCLAVVVASPALLEARCHSVEDLGLVNLLCRTADEGVRHVGEHRRPARPLGPLPEYTRDRSSPGRVSRPAPEHAYTRVRRPSVPTWARPRPESTTLRGRNGRAGSAK